MAKSKYLVELEDFKKKLPKVLLKHADMNGLDLCDGGLEAFFEEMGVEWEKPRSECIVNMSFKMMLSTTSGPYGDDVNDDGMKELDELNKKFHEFLKENKYYVEGTVTIEEAFVH